MQRENKVEVTERWSNGELVEVKANGHTIYPQRENKWQDRFRDKFGEHILKVELHSESLNQPIAYRSIENEIRSFIQSEIDTAIAEDRNRAYNAGFVDASKNAVQERKRLLDMIKNFDVTDIKQDIDIKSAIEVQYAIINLITKEQ